MTSQVLRRTLFSDKPAAMGSLDCSHEFPGFPTFLSVGATKKRPCLCHVSTRTNTPGPPPLTQRQSPAAMARVFINPGHIQATKRNVARKPSFRGMRDIWKILYGSVCVFGAVYVFMCLCTPVVACIYVFLYSCMYVMWWDYDEKHGR